MILRRTFCCLFGMALLLFMSSSPAFSVNVPDTQRMSILIVDLDGDGIIEHPLYGENAKAVYWDATNDGFKKASSWFYASEAFLAYDKNGNDIIEDSSELLGHEGKNVTVLSALDTNHDNRIDAKDESYEKIIIWHDKNEDGRDNNGENTYLSRLGTIDIVTTSQKTEQDSHPIRAALHLGEGTSLPVKEAFINYDTTNTAYGKPIQLDATTLLLPQLRGYGKLPDLYIAMSKDQELKKEVQKLAKARPEELFSDSFNVFQRTKDILYQWANVKTIPPSSRGTFIDARKLAFLEKLFGRGFQQKAFNNSSSPTKAAAIALESAFDRAYEEQSLRLLAQVPGISGIFRKVSAYDFPKDGFVGEFVLNEDLSLSLPKGQTTAGLCRTWRRILWTISKSIGFEKLDTNSFVMLKTAIDESDPSDLLSFERIYPSVVSLGSLEDNKACRFTLWERIRMMWQGIE